MGPVCPGKGPGPNKPALCLPGTWGGDVDREAKSSLMRQSPTKYRLECLWELHTGGNGGSKRGPGLVFEKLRL